MYNSFSEKIYKAIRSIITRKVFMDLDRIPFTFDNVPRKKIFNWIKAESSNYFKSQKPWAYPTHLQIEPTTFCNLKCALCPVTSGMSRTPCNLPFETFARLIDEIGEYLFLLLLWDWGEPFLNPRIFEMISYAKQQKIKIVSSTNGHLFAQEDYAIKLVQSGIDAIIFAVDGITQQSYERYRVKGDIDTVFSGIKNVIKAKRLLGSKTPLVNFRFIVMKHNEHEIAELKKLMDILGVDLLTLKTLNPYSNNTYGDNSSAGIQPNEFLPDGYRRFKYAAATQTRIRVKKNPCKNLWNCPTVHAGGVVCPCTYDYNENFVLGELNKDTFKEIWFGKSYGDMRRAFRSHGKKQQFCRECSYAYEGGNCINETVLVDNQ